MEENKAIFRTLPTPYTQAPQEKKKINLKYERDKARETVTGVFRYYEVPGGVMEFVYREYKEDPVEIYRMTDGCVYTVPRGVMRHLNKNTWYPEYEHYRDAVGGLMQLGKHGPMVAGINPDMPDVGMRISRKVKRCGFESLEFTELDDVPAAQRIVQVEHAV